MSASENRPAWLNEQVLPEALGFVNRIAADFRISIETANRHAPNPKDRQCRSLVLNEFFNVLPDVAAKIVCDFGDSKPEIEEIFVQLVRARFETARKEKNAKNVKIHSAPTIVPPL